MARYRKKPVEIDAWLFDGTWSSAEPIIRQAAHITWSDHGKGELAIETLEGVMRANPGDYVIRGIKGEWYPCKPDIFAATYDVA